MNELSDEKDWDGLIVPAQGDHRADRIANLTIRQFSHLALLPRSTFCLFDGSSVLPTAGTTDTASTGSGLAPTGSQVHDGVNPVGDSSNGRVATGDSATDSASRESSSPRPVQFQVAFYPLPDSARLLLLPAAALYASGIASSAVHLAAWNWEFPSPTVQTLWRAFGVAALGAAALPVLSVIRIFLLLSCGISSSTSDADTLLTGRMGLLWKGLVWLILLIYIASRLALLSLSFYCFSSIPASAYIKVDWTAFIPHFS